MPYKRETVLITSVTANIALLVILFFCFLIPRSTQAVAGHIVPDPADAETGKAKLLRALESANLADLIAAGIPGKTARDIVRGRIYARFRDRTLEISQRNRPADERYWMRSNAPPREGRRSYDLLKARRELDDSLQALGERDMFADSGQSNLNFLPLKKQAQIRRIKQDYEEMRAELGSADGFLFKSDRTKLGVLYEEEDREIAELFSPFELQQYRMHTSSAALHVANEYGQAIRNEADYGKIYALQKSFEDKFNNFDAGVDVAERERAELELRKKIVNIIGMESFSAAQREMDREHKALISIAKRLSLPAATADEIYVMRSTYSDQSLAIANNDSLPADARRNQLKALGQKAQASILTLLSPEGYSDYADHSAWLEILERGSGFTTNAGDAFTSRLNLYNTVYPVNVPAATGAAGETPVTGTE
jgi:hypothetical protein